MSRFQRLRDEVLRKNRHASAEELLAFLDGELPSRRADWVRRHLEVCWSCRAESARTARTVSDLMDYRDRLVEVLAKDAPRGELPLEKPLSAPAEPARRRPVHRWAVSLASLALGLALLYLILGPTDTVSVANVLERAALTERSAEAAGGGVARYRKLAVRRWRSPDDPVQTAVFEIWSDARQKRVRHTGDERIWAEIDQVVAANRREQPLLTVRGFNQWRQSVPRKREAVVERRLSNGESGWMVATEVDGAVPENGILEGRLTVREANWSPVLESIRVQGSRGERVYELEALESRVTGGGEAFAEEKLPPPAVAEREVAEAPAGADQPAPAAPEPDGILEEVSAHYALHRIGICLDGTLEVARDPDGELVLRGVTGTRAQKALLAEALAGLPAVRMEIQAVDEVAPLEGDLPPASASEKVESKPAPIMEHLVQYFERQPGAGSAGARAAAHADEVVTAARELRRQTWALRRLAEAFPGPPQPRTLPSAWLIEVMVSDHVKGLRAELARLSSLLDPVLEVIGLPATAVDQDEEANAVTGWSETAQRVFGHQEQVQSLVQELFAGTDSSLPVLEAGAGLRVSAKALAAGLDTLSVRLEEEFRSFQGGRVIP